MKNMLKSLTVLSVIIGVVSCSPDPESTIKKKKKSISGKSSSEMKFESKVRSLIKQGTDLNQKDKSGIPLLIWAVEFKYVDSVNLLLSDGADPNVKVDADGSTALHGVISSEDLVESKKLNKQIAERQKINEQKIMRLLLKHGALVDFKNGWKETPLYKAAGYGREDLCQILIENGAKVNIRRKGGNSPLHCAAEDGYWKVVGLLLENRAGVNAKNDFGKTPLALADKKGKQKEHARCRKLDANFYKNADYNKAIDILQKHAAKK